MRRPLLDALRSGTPLVADGAMGTELQRDGLEPGGCGDEWSVSRPDRVRAIHASYVRVGAEVLLTNTFGTNAFVLSRYALEDRVAEFASAAAALARGAAGEDRWVLGDVGPCGGFLEPLGDVQPDALRATWRDAMTALLDGGADGILLETMTALDELLLGIEVAREAGAPLVVASMSYDPVRGGGFKTMMGVSPERAAGALAAAGADVVGANCGRMEPRDFATVGRILATASGCPVMLKPNAGQPQLAGDVVVYPCGPADLAPALVSLTHVAEMVGGCCGTGPAHIEAFTAALGR